MIAIVGDIFEQVGDAVCITTNLFVKKDGSAVMGKGVAKQAAKRWPNVPALYGHQIRTNPKGNLAFCLTDQAKSLRYNGIEHRLPYHLVALVVKPATEECAPESINVVFYWKPHFVVGDTVPGWACLAKPQLIVGSCRDLVRMATSRKWTKVFLPRLGCGAGEIMWEYVQPIMASELDNRFIVVYKE